MVNNPGMCGTIAPAADTRVPVAWVLNPRFLISGWAPALNAVGIGDPALPLNSSGPIPAVARRFLRGAGFDE
jgi:hypothetical protein